MRCIQSAQSHVWCLCVLKTDAIVWLDARMLWYSASPFFGEVDRDHQAFALPATPAARSAELNRARGKWTAMSAYNHHRG